MSFFGSEGEVDSYGAHKNDKSEDDLDFEQHIGCRRRNKQVVFAKFASSVLRKA